LYGGQSSLCKTLHDFMALRPIFHIGGYGHEIHEQTETVLAGVDEPHHGGANTPAGFFGQ
jgi:hypothetical protein